MRTQTTLEVQGMSCPSCIDHISAALNQVEGVENVEVDLDSGFVRVEHDTVRAPIARLIDRLDEEGYESKRAA